MTKAYSNYEKILDKIRKCLALSKSSNEHEAATALRQAQTLMQQHSITDFDVEHADIREESIRAGATSKPVQWETALAQNVASAFSCTVFLKINYAGYWTFVGTSPSVEIACYAFKVLFRQVKQARTNYIKTKLKRCTTTRTRRADLFCDGWVSEATALVKRFADESAATRFEDYIKNKYDMTTFEPRNRNTHTLTSSEANDWFNGKRSGKDAQLNHGVGTASPKELCN